MDPGPAHLPPEGRYDRPELESGDMVYAMRASVYSEWVPAIIRHIYKDTRVSLFNTICKGFTLYCSCFVRIC